MVTTGTAAPDVTRAVDARARQRIGVGDKAWRTATAWPPNEVEQQAWYFQGDGRANRLFTSGTLGRQPPSGDQPADRYRYDPADPVPDWMSFEQMRAWEDVQTFQWDMKHPEARHDVVT